MLQLDVVISLATKQLELNVSNRRVPFSFISKTTFALPSCISISKRPVSPGSRLATCDRTQVTRPESCIRELRCQSKHEGAASPPAGLWPKLGFSGLKGRVLHSIVPLVGEETGPVDNWGIP